MGVGSLHKERIREGANTACRALIGDADASRRNNQLDKDGCHSSRWPGCTLGGGRGGEDGAGRRRRAEWHGVVVVVVEVVEELPQTRPNEVCAWGEGFAE